MTTLKDIAQAAGVSQSTASRALNGNPKISEKTRERVNEIAQKLNYYPDFSAKNLSKGITNIIGVIFPLTFEEDQAANTFHLEIIQGINSALDVLDYKIMLVMGRNESTFLDQVKSMVEEVKVQKFVLLYSEKNDPVSAYLRKKQIDFVIVGHPFHGERFVDNDNFKVGEAATKLILDDFKIKQPVFICAEQERPFEHDRKAGYCQVMRQRGLKTQIINVNEHTEIKDHIKNLDGIIFSDDMIFIYFAREVLKYDLPIVCFNDSEWVKLIFEKETTIDLQPRLLGKRAIELLFEPSKKYFYVPYQIQKGKY